LDSYFNKIIKIMICFWPQSSY